MQNVVKLFEELHVRAKSIAIFRSGGVGPTILKLGKYSFWQSALF